MKLEANNHWITNVHNASPIIIHVLSNGTIIVTSSSDRYKTTYDNESVVQQQLHLGPPKYNLSHRWRTKRKTNEKIIMKIEICCVLGCLREGTMREGGKRNYCPVICFNNDIQARMNYLIIILRRSLSLALPARNCSVESFLCTHSNIITNIDHVCALSTDKF